MHNVVLFLLPGHGPPASSASATGPAALAAGGQCCPVALTGPPASDARAGSRRNMPEMGGGQDILTYQKEQGPRWVGTPTHYETQTGWNSKPGRISRRNPNGLELQATTQLKWAGTPSHYKTQMGWNSKPLQTQMGWNSKPWQNSNSSKLQVMTI